EPGTTIFFLISDLEAGGNRAGLLRRVEELKDSGVTVVVLLAIADGGKPYYDAQTAQRISAMDIPCFACAPERLPELLERVLKGQSLRELAKEKAP
ncbi:MAG: VWA domain-containing protein, partial [Oscillospiraceae bacterium]|nr:VWA domain-containing protein [Oscillospiraceae bacterium]